MTNTQTLRIVDDACNGLVSDFTALPIEEFFTQHPEHEPSFVLAAPKQKAIKRVLSEVLSTLEGRIIIKRSNKRDSSTYAMDTKTGVVFGFAELKPGDLANTFGRGAERGAPKGTRYIRDRIDASPMPVIGVIGEDTFDFLKAHRNDQMKNTSIIKRLNTSHAGIYLGARSKYSFEKIGHVNMGIAVTERYTPILRNHIEQLRQQFNDQNQFIMPEILECEGGTEDNLDAYGDIDMICDVCDSGGSVLNAKVSHARLLKRSGGVIVTNEALRGIYRSQMKDADNFIKLLSKTTDRHFKAKRPELFSEDKKVMPSENEVLSLGTFLKVMELEYSEVKKNLDKKENKPFYGLDKLAV